MDLVGRQRISEPMTAGAAPPARLGRLRAAVEAIRKDAVLAAVCQEIRNCYPNLVPLYFELSKKMQLGLVEVWMSEFKDWTR